MAKRIKNIKRHLNRILRGDALNVLKTLPAESVDCCVTSPPYWRLRDYGVAGQIGLEKTLGEYIDKLLAVFSEVYRVLRKTGTLWLNLGDTYTQRGYCGGNDPAFVNNSYSTGIRRVIPAGLKRKELMGIPWRLAFCLQESGWYLRSDIIWQKKNPLPESVKDRPTKSHEYLFLMSKSARYYYDHESIREPIAESSKLRLRQNIKDQKGSNRIPGKTNGPMKAVCYKSRRKSAGEKWKYTGPGQSKLGGAGTSFPGHSGYFRKDGTPICGLMRNKRTVWQVATQPMKDAHFATFPEKLIIPCIKAGCPEDGIVLDPFIGSGTTALVARKLNRNFIGIELNPAYIQIAKQRLQKQISFFIK